MSIEVTDANKSCIKKMVELLKAAFTRRPKQGSGHVELPVGKSCPTDARPDALFQLDEWDDDDDDDDW